MYENGAKSNLATFKLADIQIEYKKLVLNMNWINSRRCMGKEVQGFQ